MVFVIDYGGGNTFNFHKVLTHLSVPFKASADSAELAGAPIALLMGVGHFGGAMEELTRRGFDTAIKSYVAGGGRLFGVCVGMQVLFEGSEEAPGVAGLGLLPGTLRKLTAQPDAPVPHVGFDEVRFDKPSQMTDGLADGTDFYFTHSFAMIDTPPDCWTAKCMHGGTSFVAAVDNGKVGGVQFHPEKSQSNGIAMLRNVLAPYMSPAP
ncbi:MAG: imidazole glycerol phosphate synthase subunit HisH [Rhodospirillaceae bacterium]